MSSKRGGVRRKKENGSSSWKNPLASLDPTKNMARRVEDVEDVSQYLHKLNDEEKLWMAQFMNEYNNARMDFKDLSNNLHNTQELKKACTDRINARNRCIYSIEKAKGLLDFAASDYELETYIHGEYHYEDEESGDY